MVNMRVIIAGSRKFNDYDLLKKECNAWLAEACRIEIISGHAQGADLLGERFANEFYYPLKVFPANWNLYGRSAGYIRNKAMAEYANEDLKGFLIAFWDRKSTGTKNMIDICNRMYIPVHICYYEEIKKGD
jgi:hypothetical protein